MENLSISDSGPAGAQGGPQLAAPQQLPPQMFTTAAQLLDMTDSKAALPTSGAMTGIWILGEMKWAGAKG